MRRALPYDEWLLSGRQIFLAEGVDYFELAETIKQKLHEAGRRRGLRVATKTIFDPEGFVFQAYLPTQPRPVLGNPIQKVNKKTHSHLFCHHNECQNRLRPIDEDFCFAHK